MVQISKNQDQTKLEVAVSDPEAEAKNLIERIAAEVRPDATQKRIQKSIQLVLESFAPDHVLTELLQNADDEGATVAEIKLTDKGILFTHNGHEFNEKNVRALCDIGETTKKPGVHIGFMGIGFKATFKISDKPHVFSGPYRFYFTREEVIVPYWLDVIPIEIEKELHKDLTTFFFPFRPDLPTEIIESLEQTMFKKLEPLCLVFLKNIEKISVKSGSNTRVLTKSKEILFESALGKKRVSVIEKKGKGKKRTYNYLVFNKELEIPDYAKNDYRARESRRADLKTTVVTLAFSLKNGLIQPVKSVLYTFLPTPFETGLRFAVNCDFLLNTQRTEIDLISQWNIWLLDSVSKALIEIVREFVQDKKQQLCFYDALPRKREVSEKLFPKIASPLIDYMKHHPLIVTSSGHLAEPTEVVLASREVQKIIAPEKAGARYFVNVKILGKAFLKEELNVRDLTERAAEIKHMLEVLKDRAWMMSLNTRQVRAIYEYLYRKLCGNEKDLSEMFWHEHREIVRNLQELEIIRSVDGRYHKARETLLPQKSGKQSNGIDDLPCLIFVDPKVLNDLSFKLFKELGVNDCSEESIVTKILDSQRMGEWQEWSEEHRLKSISYIAEWLKKKNYESDSKMREKLGYLVLPVEGGGWTAAHICYASNSELKEILPTANYVDISTIEKRVGHVECFLNAVGMLSFPRVLVLGKKEKGEDTPRHISAEKWRDYWSWLDKEGKTEHSTSTPTVLTVCLDGFDECVLSQDVSKLSNYLNFLLKHWDEYYKLYQDSEYCWYYYKSYSKKVPSYFAFQLKTQKWLPCTRGLATPNEVFAPLREVKAVGGNIICYLKIPEEQARQQKGILQYLGVETQVGLKMLLSILTIARDVEWNDSLKAQLGRIYQRMAALCEDEKIDQEVCIPDRKGNFQPSKSLYWFDDHETERAFGDELLGAWVPDNMSRTEIETLFNALGVTRISAIVKRERVADGQEIIEDDKLTSELREKGVFLYSVLLHYKSGRVDEFPNFARKAVVVRQNQLRLRLKVLDKTHEAEVPCLCDRAENRLYVSLSTRMTDLDIARELARAFEAPAGSEFTIKFVLTQSPNAIPAELRKSSVQLVPLPESLEGEPIHGEEGKMPVILPKVGAQATEGTDVSVPQVYFHTDAQELATEIDGLTQLLTEGKVPETSASDVWVEPVKIDKITTAPRVVVSHFLSASSKKSWHTAIVDGERVFVETELEPSKIEMAKGNIKGFKERMQNIIKVMGGNPDTVNVCVAKSETDGYQAEGQLFFNVLRNDKPLRWVAVAARELAYVKFPKPSQAHISLMTDLIEKALERIQEIYPELFTEKSAK